MTEHEDWRDMPISLEAKRFIEATRRASLDEREMMIRFASVLCRCTPWYDYEDPHPPQEDCVVHTTIMFDMRGDWL